MQKINKRRSHYFSRNKKMDKFDMLTPQPAESSCFRVWNFGSRCTNRKDRISKNSQILSEEKKTHVKPKIIFNNFAHCKPQINQNQQNAGKKLMISNSRKPGFRPNTSLQVRGIYAKNSNNPCSKLNKDQQKILHEIVSFDNTGKTHYDSINQSNFDNYSKSKYIFSPTNCCSTGMKISQKPLKIRGGSKTKKKKGKFYKSINESCDSDENDRVDAYEQVMSPISIRVTEKKIRTNEMLCSFAVNPLKQQNPKFPTHLKNLEFFDPKSGDPLKLIKKKTKTGSIERKLVIKKNQRNSKDQRSSIISKSKGKKKVFKEDSSVKGNNSKRTSKRTSALMFKL